MFRRKLAGRRPLRAMRGGFAGQVSPLLQRANRMMADGQYTAAADAFDALAAAARQRGGPRAPLFILQAGRARILAGQKEAGLAQLKQGLSILVERADWRQLQRDGRRVLAELHESGMAEDAAEVERWLAATLPAMPAIQSAPSSGHKPVLPTQCPSCGAALLPDEIAWLDDMTVECAYCGNPIRKDG